VAREEAVVGSERVETDELRDDPPLAASGGERLEELGDLPRLLPFDQGAAIAVGGTHVEILAGREMVPEEGTFREVADHDGITEAERVVLVGKKDGLPIPCQTEGGDVLAQVIDVLLVEGVEGPIPGGRVFKLNKPQLPHRLAVFCPN